MKPLVSIIIPIYNVEEFLEECLDSVINQTYAELEIIAVNDGSTDDSLQILRKYSSQHKHIKVITQINSGQSIARNKGVESSNGKYILFLDSDDYLLSNTVEELVNKMENNNLDLIRFSAKPFSKDPYFKIVKDKYHFGRYFTQGKIYSNQEFNEINIKAFSPSPVLYMLNKNFMIRNDLKFNTKFKMFEDELFTLEVFLKCGKTMYEPEKYYQRRFREKSIMTSSVTNETVLEAFNIKCNIIEELYKLLKIYKLQYQRNLILERITVNNKLIFLTKNINSSYKKKKIKNINKLNTTQYYYYLFYYTLRRKLRNWRTSNQTQ